MFILERGVRFPHGLRVNVNGRDEIYGFCLFFLYIHDPYFD